VELTKASELYDGDFMAGFTLRDAEEFTSWQSYELLRLRTDLSEALNRLASAYTIQGQ
jgi:hypothetical protein